MVCNYSQQRKVDTHVLNLTARRSRNGDEIQVHYTGTLLSGKVFDSSVDRGVPISFPLGGGRVIQGTQDPPPIYDRLAFLILLLQDGTLVF